MNGNVVPNATTQQLTADAEVEEFIIRKGDGTILARLDPTWGIDVDNPTEIRWPTLYLKGCLKPNIASLSPPTGAPSFKVKGDGGVLVAYICSEDDTANDIPAGSLVLKGRAFIGANPDPNAPKTELLIYDDFEDLLYTNCPTAYSSSQYATCPPWDPVPSMGDWAIHGPTKSLWNQGTYDSSDPWDTIRIDQYEADLDINLDFCYSFPTPVYIRVRHGYTASTYVKIDPSTNTMSIGRWLPGAQYPYLEYDDHTCSPSLSVNTWFELHIRCCGKRVIAWYRPLPDSSTTLVGTKWQPEGRVITADGPGDLYVMDNAEMELPEQQRFFAFSVLHNEEMNGRWRFTNITVNGYSDGETP